MCTFFSKNLVISKKSSTFAPAFEKKVRHKQIGAVVQLVRIHACHAWGRGFESRPHRKEAIHKGCFFRNGNLSSGGLSCFFRTIIGYLAFQRKTSLTEKGGNLQVPLTSFTR